MWIFLMLTLNVFADIAPTPAPTPVQLPKAIDACKLNFPGMPQKLIDWQIANCH